MPTYEYECTHCGHSFELFQKITDEILGNCPKCKSKVKRLIGSGSGIIFKGSGFYATDYRKKTNSRTSRTKTDNPPADKQTHPGKKEGCNACQ